jgi:hypothetical protein
MILNRVHTSTKGSTLTDEVRESPVDRQLLRARKRLLWLVLFIVLLIAVVELARPTSTAAPAHRAAVTGGPTWTPQAAAQEAQRNRGNREGEQ